MSVPEDPWSFWWLHKPCTYQYISCQGVSLTTWRSQALSSQELNSSSAKTGCIAWVRVRGVATHNRYIRNWNKKIHSFSASTRMVWSVITCSLNTAKLNRSFICLTNTSFPSWSLCHLSPPSNSAASHPVNHRENKWSQWVLTNLQIFTMRNLWGFADSVQTRFSYIPSVCLLTNWITFQVVTKA